ncbi:MULTISPECIES: putative metalloprotease CJM1_0395 family protein [Pseudoalteromonas]|uniref:Metalloprotease CJM1_0395 family protein n=1 Tax=Pseudoalteromonas obscura TaxID=3048491 RepID=A0ABT7EPV8_9GAMM|nr:MULTISPECIES: putative metalloprotease CJM1_0395 family protein [Pseudoalteromonas]MBQ4839541.1 catalase [Pseudoalteromonas luteoviolacea]MDK2597020.1 putative metalloprotease CJM1_0395 family protein [Pseudoalteromonas sp. P94(2023)]
MNIVTPQPAINLNTANVYTETARRDNQLREVIPKPAAVPPPATENKALQDNDKSRTAEHDSQDTYDANGQLKDSKSINERGDEKGDGQKESQASEEELSEREQAQQEQDEQQLKELKDRDREVKLHEQAHARVGGQYAGAPSYEYQRGPDGNNYAVGGQVMIDVAPVEGDPQQTIEKMQTVRAAALAPAEPSGADRAIAADATSKIATAQAELAKKSISGSEEDKASSGVQKFQNRRLTQEGAAQSEQPVLERARLQQEADPFAVALPIERDPEIESRALRIEGFYGQITKPNEDAQLSVTV